MSMKPPFAKAHYNITIQGRTARIRITERVYNGTTVTKETLAVQRYELSKERLACLDQQARFFQTNPAQYLMARMFASMQRDGFVITEVEPYLLELALRIQAIEAQTPTATVPHV